MSLAIYVLIAPAGGENAVIGVSGLFGLPIWTMRVVLFVPSALFIYWGLRQLMTDR
ncbi:hypothetical protein B0I08_103366 [Glaciihabitans tibetensis]|uniref:Uncharacterized protein n=1 Tax=Glaciihabitans tibetensis TaxID=1266600 RepID=A0A2T0VG22_9MICO|nr:hypothetical protein [Glaciihabitans tibetensis]PRY69158.1 hypothetical protein B0I08_103366 [Glaciihabitans tibetensis]